MSEITINPYVFFGSRCEEAIEFYKEKLGAETVMLMRFSECPDPLPDMPEGYENKIMHATIRIGKSVVMVSDGCGEEPEFKGINLSISLNDIEEGRKIFESLSENGKVTMPYAKTFWAKSFGMVVDQFGVNWMVDVE